MNGLESDVRNFWISFNPRHATYSADISCRLVSVPLSVRPSKVGVLLKRLNVGSCKERHMIAQGLLVFYAENFGKFQTESSPTEAPNAGGVG